MPTLRDLFPPAFGGFASPLEDLRDEFDRLWTSLATRHPGTGPSAERSAAPACLVNMSEADDAVTIEVELPGVVARDIDISVSGDELVLKGSRPADDGREHAPGDGERPAVTWHRRERGTGPFERHIALPTAVDASRVEARLVDGVLTVTCPKAPESRPHKVQVRST